MRLSLTALFLLSLSLAPAHLGWMEACAAPCMTYGTPTCQPCRTEGAPCAMGSGQCTTIGCACYCMGDD
jgi:hypothetical protein